MNFFDLHCDTLTECVRNGENLYSNNLHVSIEKSGNFEKWCQVFAVFLPDTLSETEAAEYFDSVISFFKDEIGKNSEKISLCTDAERLRLCCESGRCGAILAMENSKAVTSVEKLSQLYEKGLRILTLTWNGANAAGGGVSSGGGLTEWGCELVRAAQSLGIVIDASHLSDAAFWDLTRVSHAPFIASHSDSRSVFRHPRSLSDEQIRYLVDTGGLVGLNFYSEFLGKGRDLDSLLSHARHMLSLGAENILCIGSDFDGCVMNPSLSGVEKLPEIREYFEQNGVSSKLCDKIFFENAFNFFENVLQRHSDML
ncbi:MAG: membrane dipeptidase [Clostridia bacterium]|nr:membrane dipeptidase [Clostridia bacterium]